jgi:hypothetical protein
MPAGMRFWDEATNLMVCDTSTAVFMQIGYYSFGGDGSAASGSMTDSNLTRGTPEAIVLQCAVGPNTTYKSASQTPIISFSGATLFWSFPAGGPNFPYVNIVYGIR